MVGDDAEGASGACGRREPGDVAGEPPVAAHVTDLRAGAVVAGHIPPRSYDAIVSLQRPLRLTVIWATDTLAYHAQGRPAAELAARAASYAVVAGIADPAVTLVASGCSCPDALAAFAALGDRHRPGDGH